MWAIPRLSPCVLLLSLVLAGCGAASNTVQNPPPPTPPQITSSAPQAAQEGVLYAYQPTATSPDMGTVTFSLTAAPTGATLSGNTVDWTPTHAQSRTANQFTLTAKDSSGGTASQSWSVTPTGTIVIADVTTYWGPTGTTNVTRVWPSSQPYPAALVPQSDGSLTRLGGSANPDGTFGIPNVPAGYYWLQLSPLAMYWTSSSNFDAGTDVVGTPLKTLPQSTTTTINFNLSGLDPFQPQDLLVAQPNTEAFSLDFLGRLGFGSGQTSLNFTENLNTNIDFSSINTFFFRQYEPVTSGTFSGLALGPAATDSNVSITNGGTNNTISATLSPGTKASIPLNIQGSAWAAELQNVAPVNVTPTLLLTDFSVSTQPFVTDRIANSLLSSIFGPNLTMLAPTVQTTTLGIPLSSYYCQDAPSGLNLNPPSGIPTPPVIQTDQDFGTISYDDPYSSSWPRMFQICQLATVQIPRPNSTVTDTFELTYGQTTAIPTAPIAPIVGPVQNPMINGSNIFQPTTLTSPAATLKWTAPSGAQPFAYFVTIFQLATTSTGSMQYATLAVLATGKTTMAVPFLSSGGTYIFQIAAWVRGGANIETSPHRSQLPIAHATVISAPITIN